METSNYMLETALLATGLFSSWYLPSVLPQQIAKAQYIFFKKE